MKPDLLTALQQIAQAQHGVSFPAGKEYVHYLEEVIERYQAIAAEALRENGRAA